MNEDSLYERVAQELDKGEIQQGTWTRAFADSDGDETKTKARYISFRVAQLSKEVEDAVDSEGEKRGPGVVQNAPIIRKSTGIFLILVDAVPALACALFLVGIALSIAITTFFLSTNISKTEWLGVLALGTILVTVAFIAALRPRRDVGSIALAWKRLLAKCIDFSLTSVLVILLVLWIAPTNVVTVAWLFFGGILIGWALLEAYQLSKFGSTLGRSLVQIRLNPIHASNNSFVSYLNRSIALVFYGIALSLPFFTVLAQAVAYKRVREHGSTIWDDEKFNVTANPAGFGKIFIAILALAFLVSLGGALGKSIGRNVAIAVADSMGSSPDFGQRKETRVDSSPQIPSKEIQESTPNPKVDWSQYKFVSRPFYLSKDQFNTIEQAHPGWTETIKSAEFKNCLNQRPNVLKKWRSDEPRDLIAVLSMYKQGCGAFDDFLLGESQETQSLYKLKRNK